MNASPIETPPELTTEEEVVESPTLNWWWILLGGAPTFAAAAVITGYVDRRHGGDWWVLTTALIAVPVLIIAARHAPALRLRAGKTARGAAVSIGLTLAVISAAAFQLGVEMLDAAYYDGYDDGFLDGHNCGYEWGNDYDTYQRCVNDHNYAVRTGLRPPANWGD